MRTIDLNRCLVRYAQGQCDACEAICPQGAVHQHVIDPKKCDDCGLCQAVCPAGAIAGTDDCAGALARTRHLTRQVLMCRRVEEAAPSCLGFLNRRLLWSLTRERELAIDISRCETCRPAVFHWLEQEIAACQQALAKEGLPPIRLVRVHPREQAPAAPVVERRNFFRSLFHSATEGLQTLAEAQQTKLYAFDSALWIAAQGGEPGELFPQLTISSACNTCGLCTVLCPERALSMRQPEGMPKTLYVSTLACSGCGLCEASCPVKAITCKKNGADVRLPVDGGRGKHNVC